MVFIKVLVYCVHSASHFLLKLLLYRFHINLQVRGMLGETDDAKAQHLEKQVGKDKSFVRLKAVICLIYLLASPPSSPFSLFSLIFPFYS